MQNKTIKTYIHLVVLMREKYTLHLAATKNNSVKTNKKSKFYTFFVASAVIFHYSLLSLFSKYTQLLLLKLIVYLNGDRR